MLLGQKITDASPRCARCPRASTSARPAAIPTGPGPDDLEIKIQELREITDWEKPIYVKVGATRVLQRRQARGEAGADVVVVDGMQGGTAATQDVFIEHVGIPTLAAVRQAVEALEELGMHRTGAAHRLRRHPHRRRRGQGAGAGRRRGVDRQGALIALGGNDPRLRRRTTRQLGTAAGFYDDCHKGATPSASPPGSRAGASGWTRWWAAAGWATTRRADHGGPDHRAGLRQVHLHHLEREDLVPSPSRRRRWPAFRSPEPAGSPAPTDGPCELRHHLPELRPMRPASDYRYGGEVRPAADPETDPIVEARRWRAPAPQRPRRAGGALVPPRLRLPALAHADAGHRDQRGALGRG